MFCFFPFFGLVFGLLNSLALGVRVRMSVLQFLAKMGVMRLVS